MSLDDIQGQPLAVSLLRRIATSNFQTPLLFLGEAGVGRRSAVYETARELFCSGDKSNTCECFGCLQLKESVHPDFVHVRPEEGKDIGVDEIRDLIASSMSFPSFGPLKLLMIEEADRLTVAAANALLKTLEEPSPKVRFFLLTEKGSRVIPTIRSRCAHVKFGALPESFIISRLQQFEKDPTKALVYARMAEGSVGRAIQFWGSGKLELRDRAISLLDAGVRGDLPSILHTISNLDTDLPLFLKFSDQLIHDLLMIRVDPSRMIHLDLTEKLMALKLPEKAMNTLVKGLRTLLRNGARINLPFHTQALFVDAFLGT